MLSDLRKEVNIFVCFCFRYQTLTFGYLKPGVQLHYNDEPKPTQEPQKKIPSKATTAVPATVPTSHNGIRPVVPVLDIMKSPDVFEMKFKPKTRFLVMGQQSSKSLDFVISPKVIIWVQVVAVFLPKNDVHKERVGPFLNEC